MTLSAAALRRIGVAGQLAFVGGIATWLASIGWHVAVALLAGIALVLLMFGASIALAFAMSVHGLLPGANGVPALDPRMAASRREARLGFLPALRCWLRECAAVLRMFDWLQPFASHRRFVSENADGAPVLLVHGYGCNHAVWLDLEPRLAAAGFRCEGIDLEPVLGDIDDYATALLARLRAMTAAHGEPPLLVCHSMGGLAARAALVLARRSGAGEVARGLVTLGTPHHGCTLAMFGSGINARQMRCGNPWLQALAAGEDAHARARMVSIFSWHDSIVGPAGASVLAGARNVPLAGIGHVSLLRDPAVAQALVEALRRLSAAVANRAPAP
ncbi:triacylglycerol lipase [Cupriavidus sp. AU9028]|uniref:esterase/lipase family protein n=1 Tax=Cupriavidus sp. AU9028 TaxID=2871157 RepID=UPI001C96FA59|nr:alpha/beta fold hydrolase [Cupriavidus sp. AU9028]MBY4895733.1 alpha/beta fold hydrolase [Cupriavidus sp. AU9028]